MGACYFILCPRWASNPHPLRDTILSRARIPIPPLGHYIPKNFIFKLPGGLGGNRTHVYSFCRGMPYYLATRPFIYPTCFAEVRQFFGGFFLRGLFLFPGRGLF